MTVGSNGMLGIALRSQRLIEFPLQGPGALLDKWKELLRPRLLKMDRIDIPAIAGAQGFVNSNVPHIADKHIKEFVIAAREVNLRLDQSYDVIVIG